MSYCITDLAYAYCACILFYRLNTFGPKLKVGTNDHGDPIEHHVHEYHDTLKNIYLGDFKESDEFEEYCRTSGKQDLSYSKFLEGALMCPCIQEPAMRVCVDEIETGFGELVYTMKETLRRSRTKRQLCCAFCRKEEIRKEEQGAEFNVRQNQFSRHET